MAYIGHPLIGERKYIGEQTNNDDGKFQSLVSYKIIFNFKTPAGILQYLNKKTIHI
jgi:23S rRNA pseudouridine955/2504/2580 synthase